MNIKKSIRIWVLTGIVVFIVVLIGKLIVWPFLLSYLNTNALTVRLSKGERQLVEKWSDKCKCKVSFIHNYNLIHDTKKIDTPVMYIELKQFRDFKGRYFKGRYYNRDNDWCLNDSTFLVKNAIKISKAFMHVSPYAQLYKKIFVYYITYRNVGKQGSLLVTIICSKKVTYDITKKEAFIHVDTWYPKYKY